VPIPVDDDASTSEDEPDRPRNEPRAKKESHDARSKSDDQAARAIETADAEHLAERARRIHRELVAALPGRERKLVEGIPFVIDDSRGSVNAFAACLKDGRALVVLSEGLMQVQAQLARARATDEKFGTRKLAEYLTQLSRSRALRPPRDFISAAHERDPEKRARQRQLLDEGLAFVIGHELAHHRLSHTGCVGRDHDEVTTADLGRLLSRKAPMFNQPNELASDVYGIENVLRTDEGWSEDGALLMLRFFRARTRQSLRNALVFGFERTHPHPDIRIPAVEQTARTWRLTGGRSLPKIPNLVL
jgi:hypothetical protein